MNTLREISSKEKSKTIENLKEILSFRTDIIFAYIPGSFMECEQFRDIDIAVYCKNSNLSAKEVSDFEFQLSDELSTTIGSPVDVRILNNAPLGFQYHVTTGKVLISHDEEFRADSVERAWILYLDFKPTADVYLKEMFL